MKTILYPILALLVLPILTARLHAIDIVDSGAIGTQVNLNGTYTQNFDTLLAVTPSSGVPWVNNVTLPGWYSTQSSYTANSKNFGLTSFGTNSDRAFGSSGTNWSVRFVNMTDQTIGGFTFSYDVEQWFRGANDPQTSNNMLFYYRVWPEAVSEAVEVGNLTRPGWTFVTAATFASPNATLTSEEFLDGNLEQNRGTVSLTINGIDLAPGEKLWLRWLSGDDPGEDHAQAIDNLAVSFQTIPEPAAFAALLGLTCLGFCLQRRNKQRAS